MGRDSDEFEDDIGKFERQLHVRMSSSSGSKPAGVSSKSNIKFGMIPEESSSDDGGIFEDVTFFIFCSFQTNNNKLVFIVSFY